MVDSPMSNDNTTQIREQVEQALADKTALSIQGSRSHDFMLTDYTLPNSIDMTSHHGIIDYQPSELNIRARAGTPLIQIQQLLAEQHQRLPTDFICCSPASTLGGSVAIGHTGSARPFQGAIRDHILGTGLINGSAEVLKCGGQVMKNVAGYDISRLLSGSRGTLGPILDVTLKVLPVAESQHTLIFESEENEAIQAMNQLAGQSLPVSACIYLDKQLFIRLEGTESVVSWARKQLGGEDLDPVDPLWDSIQQQSHTFFESPYPLWRIIVPATSDKLELENHHHSLIDWCGGLRWVYASEITQSDFIHITNLGGYIENYRGANPTQPADLMTDLQKQMHRRVKTAFDPQHIFNPALSSFE